MCQTEGVCVAAALKRTSVFYFSQSIVGLQDKSDVQILLCLLFYFEELISLFPVLVCVLFCPASFDC